MRRLDREQAFPDELYAAWVEMGLLRLPFAEEYGGLGGSALDMVMLADEISYKSFDLFTAYGGRVFCGLNVLRKGSEEQKRYWLPKLLSGEIKMSISMSEPDAGSDIGSMRTAARRDGDEWMINGQKLWARRRRQEQRHQRLRQDRPGVYYRKGMSLFLVPNDTPGLEMRKLDMLGRRCTGTYELTSPMCACPRSRLVGGENNGWACVLAGLQIERITAAAGYCGGSHAAFELALGYAKERKQFGRPIGTFQAIAHMLADMQTELEAARP